MSDHTPTPVEIQYPGGSRPHRTPTPGEGTSGVSAKRLTVPILIAVSLAGSTFGFGITWQQVAEHHKDPVVHLPKQATIDGGGPAFKNEVTAVEHRLTRKIEDEGRRQLRAMRSMRINCRKSGDGLSCRTELPDDAE